jgi:hypothetical protein
MPGQRLQQKATVDWAFLQNKVRRTVNPFQYPCPSLFIQNHGSIIFVPRSTVLFIGVHGTLVLRYNSASWNSRLNFE